MKKLCMPSSELSHKKAMYAQLWINGAQNVKSGVHLTWNGKIYSTWRNLLAFTMHFEKCLPKLRSEHTDVHIFAGLGIPSFSYFAQIKWATVSDWLRSLKTNEWPWANRSGRSEEMSDRERIAQVAQDKWATMSDSLRSLRGNEPMSDSLKKFWLTKS